MASVLMLAIAGHPLRLAHSHAYMQRIACDFRLPHASEGTDITVSSADLDAERALIGQAAPEGYVEALALERAVARALATKGVFHMHAVAVAVDGEAYVLTADSGVGKTTHAHNWLALLGDRAEVIADDKPFFSFAGDTLLVHGSPWRGREGNGRNVSMPVKAFGILRRADSDDAVRATPSEAMAEFFLRTYMPEDAVGAASVLALADRTLSAIPVWCLFCTNSIHAAEVAYHAMSKKE